MYFNKKLNSFVFVFFYSLMVGCSSSSKSSDDDDGDDNDNKSEPKNVAAASNGATVTSTFSGNETFTIDEDVEITNFWIGGADGDEVKVAFDETYSVSKIIVRTNNTGFNVNGGVTLSGIRAQLSSDDVTYEEVALAPFGLSGAIACASSSIGSGRIECTLNPAVDAKFVKVIVTSDFAATEIYEIEVTGQ